MARRLVRGQRRQERHAVELRRFAGWLEEPGQVEERRRHVDELHLAAHALAAGDAAAPHDQRHADQLVEERVTVQHTSVVDELLAVVGRDDQDGVALIEAARFEALA